MDVLICRDWRSACSTWLWMTTVPGAVLVPTEIRPDVHSWEQGEPDAANWWSSRIWGGRGQDGYWQLSWDMIKEGIREWTRKGVLTSEELAHLPLKVQCFQREIKRFIFGPEHTQGLNLRLKMGWNWLKRVIHLSEASYSVDFCGVFFFLLSLLLFYMGCLGSTMNNNMVTKTLSDCEDMSKPWALPS